MYDDRSLVELMNSRFDDLISRMEDMKRDTIRVLENHEKEDKEKFNKLDERVQDVEKLKWKISGAMALALGIWKYIEKKI